jgi:hypothetical protein
MSNIPATESTPANLRGLRRAAIIAIIASLSIAALVGIITLLVGDFGEVQLKILLTTLLLAGFSITALCHLAVAGRAQRAVGFTGLVVSGIAGVTGLALIWLDLSRAEGDDALSKTFIVSALWAASIAHASLLLVLSRRRNRPFRAGLIATVLAVALVALLVTLPIVTDGEIPGDWGDYWRLFGVIAILDVLGSIVLPVAGRFVRDEPLRATTQPDATAGTSSNDAGSAVLTLELPAELEALLVASAARSGVSRERAAVTAIENGLR